MGLTKMIFLSNYRVFIQFTKVMSLMYLIQCDAIEVGFKFVETEDFLFDEGL